MRWFMSLLCLLLLSACSKGLDRSLVTGEGIEQFQASLQKAAEEMTPEEKEAFSWAVSDFDLARLHKVYPDASPRQIIRGEVKEGLAEWPAQLAELEAQKAKFDPILAELRKIEARAIKFELDRGLSGLEPKIHATVVNGGQLDVSWLEWRASLYLDDGEKPVAVSEVFDNYNRTRGSSFMNDDEAPVPAGGMRSGMEYARTFYVGMGFREDDWTTLEIQNASKRVVVLEPILGSIKDFGDRVYLEGAPYKNIRLLQDSIEAAKKYEHI